jgi:aryl-alcohol dehydrogenase-like predicted oxidoreductase
MCDELAELGDSGLTVSRLGLGGCPLGGHGWGADFNERDATAAVRHALDRGITFFDTADVYGLGRSEELLSKALGINRFEVIVATKFGVAWDDAGRTWRDISPCRVRTALEASLRRLRLECIPLYYIHWPDGRTPLADVLGELERCRTEGKIGAIGLSNYRGGDLAEAKSTAPISALQIQCSLVDREAAREAAPAASRHRVPLVAWGALAQGLLTGKYDATAAFGRDDRRSRYENFAGDKFAANVRLLETLKGVAARVGKSPAQVALRWALQAAGVGVVLFGAKRPAQVDENCGAADWRLDDADHALLTHAAEQSTDPGRRRAA